MFWKLTHDFLKWLWPSLLGTAIAASAVAVAAAQVWEGAKRWEADAFLGATSMMQQPWIWVCSGGMFLIWFGAFIYSSHRLTAVDQVALKEKSAIVVQPTRTDREPAPAIPITLNSLGAYLRGYPRTRNLTQRICQMLDRPVNDQDQRASWSLTEQAIALGYTEINQLDQAMADDETLILRIAPYFLPDKIALDYSITCLLWVSGGRLGADEYWNRIKALSSTSTSHEFCKEVERIYHLITKY
jgi:hypothetical protein